MPTLQFKGKNIIWNHHLSVPYHSLEEVEELHFQPEKGNGNLIIEGDNLIALKALLPEYAGKVKCIYIDPPYNTGDDNGNGKGWIYNDNVNSPLIKEWLKNEVGSDDLAKHDKWLCMMTPRLKLLRELLEEDGVILISINFKFEHANLRMICDEIFQEGNLIGELTWESTTQPINSGSARFGLQQKIEPILFYAKDKSKIKSFNLVESDSGLSYPHIGKLGACRFEIIEKSDAGNYRRDTMKFEILGQKPRDGKRWQIGEDTAKILIENNRIEIVDDVVKRAVYPVDELDKRSFIPFWSHFSANEVGSAQTGKDTLNETMGFAVGFDTVKPVELIKKIISYLPNNSIILDSFAGSGTTMHAVNELNKDGGNRKCILVQMKENTENEPDKNICKDITRERNKKAIEKYEYESGFKYLRVGTAIDPEKMLEGVLPTFEQFAKYIYYLGTGEHLAEAKNINSNTHFVGNHGAKVFFLIYEQDVDALSRLALNLHIAEEIVKQSPNKRRVIYAPACFLDSEYMEEKQIEFVSIPYNLFERNAK
jgi:adenine-specific DNA-methyltransferase